jgi:hypothetical protein
VGNGYPDALFLIRKPAGQAICQKDDFQSSDMPVRHV